MENKLAVILPGGGFKSARVAGFLQALKDKYNIVRPFTLITCSGSILPGAEYVAGEYGRMKNLSIPLSKKGIVKFYRFGKIIDTDRIMDILRCQNDLLGKIFSSSINFVVPAINAKTGKMKYFSNKDEFFINHPEEFYNAMWGGISLPFASSLNPKIKVGKFYYCDSLISAESKSHLKKAITLGAEKILLINHEDNSKYFDREKFIFNLWFKFKSKSFQENYLNLEEKIKNYEMYDFPQKKISHFFLTIPNKSGITTLDNRKKNLYSAYYSSYQYTCNHNKLSQFLEEV